MRHTSSAQNNASESDSFRSIKLECKSATCTLATRTRKQEATKSYPCLAIAVLQSPSYVQLPTYSPTYLCTKENWLYGAGGFCGQHVAGTGRIDGLRLPPWYRLVPIPRRVVANGPWMCWNKKRTKQIEQWYFPKISLGARSKLGGRPVDIQATHARTHRHSTIVISQALSLRPALLYGQRVCVQTFCRSL